MMGAAPPRLLQRAAARAVRGKPWSEAVLGDLNEEFAALAARLHDTRTFFAIGDRPVRTVLQEVRFALRALWRQKLVSAAVVATFALGLGANAAAFSMLRVLVLQPFAFDGTDRLAVISEYTPAHSDPDESVSPANFRDWREQATTRSMRATRRRCTSRCRRARHTRSRSS